MQSLIKYAALSAAFFATAPSYAGTVATQPATTPPQPKLIVAIAVDQYSADLFAEYRGRGTGGLKRLQQGVVFPSGYQSHAATETCPGHSTILTGTRPANTGIVANNWIDPTSTRKGKDGKPDYAVYCAEDENVPGSNSTHYTVSPKHLKALTLGDRLKAIDPANRVVAISGKDRAAVMMGGHHIDQAYWWDGKAFATFVGTNTPPPSALTRVNAAATAAIAKPAAVSLLPACATHSNAIPIGGGKTVGTLAPRTPGDARAFRASADLDRLTLDLATSTMNEMKLGQGKGTDVLAVSLSATDYIGHTYGTEGAEMCQQMYSLDAQLGGFLTKIDALKVPYVVVLTADHGGHDTPERNQIHAAPDAKRVGAASLSDINKAIAAKEMLTSDPIIGEAPYGDLYLKSDVPADKRGAVIADAKDIILKNPDVQTIFTKAELTAQAMPSGPPETWSLIERARASFDPTRTGDLYVVLKPRVTPIPDSTHGYIATHGSIWDYDRRVPILFYWPGVQGFEQPLGVETVDILPTLASLIALPIGKGEIDGRCLDIDGSSASNCK